MKRTSAAAVLVILALFGLLAWSGLALAIATVRLAWADEQTAVFDQMVDQASQSLANSPPDVAKAVSCLDYAHGYYPSGTKQTAGSRLDRIVERSRHCCEQRIIDLLRRATARDRGSDPEDWIKAYLTRPDA